MLLCLGEGVEEVGEWFGKWRAGAQPREWEGEASPAQKRNRAPLL